MSDEEEVADKYYAAWEYVTRQGTLVGELFAQDKKESAADIMVAVGVFLMQFTGLMHDDLLYAYHVAWKSAMSKDPECIAT